MRMAHSSLQTSKGQVCRVSGHYLAPGRIRSSDPSELSIWFCHRR